MANFQCKLSFPENIDDNWFLIDLQGEIEGDLSEIKSTIIGSIKKIGSESIFQSKQIEMLIGYQLLRGTT